MALLRPALAGLCLVAGSCALSEPLGASEAWVRSCPDEGPCQSHFAEGQAFIDRSASRHAPDGVYLYLELETSDGALASIELDVPAAEIDDASADVQVSYRERDGDRVVFESEAATGLVTLPEAWFDGGARCGCDDVAFALRFEGAPGEGARLITGGRAGWDETRCGPTHSLGGAETLTVGATRCPGPTTPTAVPLERPATPATRQHEVDHVHDSCGCNCDDEGVVYVGGCQSDPAYDDDSSGGCDGGSSGSSDGSGGCEGDDSSSSSGGCDGGGGSSGGGGCEGDTSDAPDANCRIAPRRRGGGPWVSLGIPLLLAVSYLQLRARALRRRGPARD